MAGGSAFAVLFGQVGSVCMHSKDHITCFVLYACIGVCRHVVEELVAGLGNGDCAFGLMCSNGAECGE